jgi:hypothetical protein
MNASQSVLSTLMLRRTPQDAKRAPWHDSAPQIRLRCVSAKMACDITKSEDSGLSQLQRCLYRSNVTAAYPRQSRARVAKQSSD